MADQPNIVFVFADQLRYDALACNGNRMCRRPTSTDWPATASCSTRHSRPARSARPTAGNC